MSGHLSPTPPVGANGSGALRVGIIGLGPKGMFALERLLDHAAREDPGSSIEIDAYEPHPAPGAGPVYDPGQPTHLRMNFAAGHLDMWPPGSTAVPEAERRSFVDWSRDRGRACDPFGYPARADVGRYLSDGLRALLAHAPPHVLVTVRQARVRAVLRVDRRWEVVAAGSSDPSNGRRSPVRPRPYDEVLIATGHDRSSTSGRLDRSWSGPAVVVPAVFPVERHLSTDRVPPGARVAVRGFALSFIDAVLSLTEGRGGRFEPSDGQSPDVGPGTCRLRYQPGDADVRVILPFSRTGRPMLAKPAADLALRTPALETIAERGRRRLAGLDAPVGLHRDLLPILAACARDSLLAAGGGRRLVTGIGDWLERAAAGAPVAADESPVVELRRSLAVGAALVPPDVSWALGQTWRAVYPALVAGLGGDRLAAADWPAFRRLCAEFERISFGPPPVNAAKLLALIDAGRVDLTHLRGGRLACEAGTTVLSSGHGACPVDVVIDAVLPGPGADLDESGLLGRLAADGHVRVAPGRRGIDVGADGSCRRADGSMTPGLAAIGRPTEDSVIGNDTLSRTLHPLADRWARRVLGRSQRLTAATVLAGVCGGEEA